MITTITYSLTKNDNPVIIIITQTMITLIIIYCDNDAESYHLVFSCVFHWPSKPSHESGLASSRLWRDLLLSPCCTQKSIPPKGPQQLVDIVVENEGALIKCLKKHHWKIKEPENFGPCWGRLENLSLQSLTGQASIDLATLCECTEDISSGKTAAKIRSRETWQGDCCDTKVWVFP